MYKGLHTQSYHVVVTCTSMYQSYMCKHSHVNFQHLQRRSQIAFLRGLLQWESIDATSSTAFHLQDILVNAPLRGNPPRSFLSMHQLAWYTSNTYARNAEVVIAENCWNQLLLNPVTPVLVKASLHHEPLLKERKATCFSGSKSGISSKTMNNDWCRRCGAAVHPP